MGSGRATSQVRVGPACPALVGRSDEVRTLLSIVDGPPGFAAIEGPAGIGKTRLVAELVEQVEATVQSGRCEPVREPFPLGPVVEALGGIDPATIGSQRLSPVAGAAAPLLPELAPQLPPAPSGSDDTALARHQQFRALREILEAVGRCVLVLEDLHWADDTTLEYLQFLLSRPPPHLVVVATWRREDLDDTSPLPGLVARPEPGLRTAHVTLQPLAVEAVHDFLSAALDGQDVSPEFTEYLHDRSGGVPFCIEEMLRLLQDRDDVRRRDGRWERRSLEDLAVPTAVRDAVAERLARLPSTAGRVASALAVLREPPDPQLLAEVLEIDLDAVVAGLTDLAGTGLVETDDGITFRHALAQEAARDRLPAAARAVLHQRVAEVLEARPDSPAVELVHHWRAAGRHDRWLRHVQPAAEQALAAGSYSTVVRLLHEPLASRSVEGDDEQQLAALLGEAALHSRAHAQVVDVLRDAVARHPEAGEVRRWFAALLFQAGDIASGSAHMRRAAELLVDDPVARAKALSHLALPHGLGGDIDEHLRCAQEAVATAEASGDDGLVQSVRVDFLTLLISLGLPGGWDAFAELWEQDWSALPLERLRLATNIAYGAYLDGSYERCTALLDQARELSEALAYTRFVPVLDGIAALVGWATGRGRPLDGALTEFAAGSPSAAVEIRLVQGAGLLAAGSLPEAEAVLRSVIEQAAAAGEAESLLATTGQLLRLQLGTGDVEAAVRTAEDAIGMARRTERWIAFAPVVPWVLRALLAGDEPAGAAAFLQEVEGHLATSVGPVVGPALAHCRGVVAQGHGELATAARHFAEAAAGWEQLPHPFQAAMAQGDRGVCLVEADPDEATALLEAAEEAYTSLEATWDAARVQQRLRRHGLAGAHHRGRKGYGDALSPREAEVAELARAGRSNREIAETLFLSPRTVERHMSSVLRKLGISSRDEITRELVVATQ